MLLDGDIMHEILNHIVTITKLYQVTAFSCRFRRKGDFAQQNGRNKKCWLSGVQETKCPQICTTGHGKSFLVPTVEISKRWIPAVDVNRCNLLWSMFCFCLLRLGLAVTGSSGPKSGNADTRGNAMKSQNSVQKPQPFGREWRLEAVSNRGPNALPLGQTCSR